MQCSVFNLTFQITIHHPITSNNCNSVVSPVLINISVLLKANDIKNIFVLILPYIQCLYLMNPVVAWALVSSGTQVWPQIILDTGYLPDCFFVRYGLRCPPQALTTIGGLCVSF